MTDVTDLQTRLENLKKLRDGGVSAVRHGETFTQNYSLAEINQAIAALEGEIAGLSGTPRRRVKYFFQSGKGL